MKLRRSIPVLKKGVETTPFVNIVLLLTLFFLLSSSFVFQPGVRVDLPRRSSRMMAGISGARYILALSAEQDGRMYFNDQVVDSEVLFTQLKAIAQKEAHPAIVVRADRNLSHGHVSEIVQAITELGFSVVLATQ